MIKVIIFDISGVILYAEDTLSNVLAEWGKELGLPEGKSVEFHNRLFGQDARWQDHCGKEYFSIFKKEFHR